MDERDGKPQTAANGGEQKKAREHFPPWVRRFLLPLTVILLFFGLPYLLRPISQVLLAAFAGILLAIFLDGAAALFRRWIPVPRGVALAIVIILIFVAFAGMFWLAGAQMMQQAARLIDQLPAALETVRSRIMENEWLSAIYSRLSQGGGVLRNILGNITSIFSSTLGILGNIVIILFTGIYVAVSPGVYSGALLRLLPPDKRAHGKEVLGELGRVMRYWLVGRLASMTVVGILTAGGLLFIGQPLALILGLIAGLLSFIPFLGPLLSALPAVLVGLSESTTMAAKVALVFAIVQFIESNLITPLIERRAVMVPPAFVVAGQFLMATLAGFYGVLLAMPLIVLITVLVQILYIQDILGDCVQVLGDHDG